MAAKLRYHRKGLAPRLDRAELCVPEAKENNNNAL